VRRLTPSAEQGLCTTDLGKREGGIRKDTTLRNYAHVLPGMQREAAEAIDSGLLLALFPDLLPALLSTRGEMESRVPLRQ